MHMTYEINQHMGNDGYIEAHQQLFYRILQCMYQNHVQQQQECLTAALQNGQPHDVRSVPTLTMLPACKAATASHNLRKVEGKKCAEYIIYNRNCKLHNLRFFREHGKIVTSIVKPAIRLVPRSS